MCLELRTILSQTIKTNHVPRNKDNICQVYHAAERESVLLPVFIGTTNSVNNVVCEFHT